MESSKAFIFGAKATAAGLYKALSAIEPEKKVEVFLVSETVGNVQEIWGIAVKSISDVSEELSELEKKRVLVYVAVPELIHKEIRELLVAHGFSNIIMVDSRMEADLMGQYFEKEGKFLSVHNLSHDSESLLPNLTIYVASFYNDKPLKNPPALPVYYKKIYLGCAGAEQAGVNLIGQADFYDNTRDNISSLNPNRCEMTAHYWVWKNKLENDDEYVGICHYRRLFDLSGADLRKIKDNDVDVVLPYPMIHYPNAAIQHTWYVPEKDWELMRAVVNDLYPEYGEKFDSVFSEPEFYNYNMLVAKKKVFADYCSWIYPILDKIEAFSEPKGCERHDRYTAYLSESLETLYFMSNLNHLKIYHTGRLLYT